MVAVVSSVPVASKGWFAGLFLSPRTARIERIARPADTGPEFLAAIEAATLRLALDGVEDRVRAATSGFEMGEYEPPARRG